METKTVRIPKDQRALIADFAELVIEWEGAIDVPALARDVIELNGFTRETFVETGELVK